MPLLYWIGAVAAITPLGPCGPVAPAAPGVPGLPCGPCVQSRRSRPYSLVVPVAQSRPQLQAVQAPYCQHLLATRPHGTNRPSHPRRPHHRAVSTRRPRRSRRPICPSLPRRTARTNKRDIDRNDRVIRDDRNDIRAIVRKNNFNERRRPALPQ